jgi:TolB-like protein
VSLFTELKHRSVFRVAASYAVIGWLVLQIADVVLEPIGAPDWSMRALIVLVIIGLPVAVVLAWSFEITPEGVQRDRGAPGDARPVVHGLRRYADVFVIAVLVVVIAILLAWKKPIDFEVTDTPVVAVLPFNEIGAEDNVFGMGLADTLIHKLGQVGQLVVLTSSSTFEFAGTSLDLAEVGAKLGANILLEGTVQRGSGALRVNARLVEARSGQQLWSDSYERTAADLFAVQDQIASEVSRALSVVLSADQQQRMAEPVTSSLTAFDAYTLGQVNFAERSPDGVRNALRYFREAVRLDPNFALAQARLAEVLLAAPTYLRHEVDWQELREEAWNAVEAALRLDPNLGDSHLARYYFEMAERTYAGQGTLSDEELSSLVHTAAELSPNNARAFRALAWNSEDPQQKISHLERAARLDPRSGIIRNDIAMLYAEQGDYELSVDWLLKAATTSEPYFPIGYTNIPVIWAFYAGRQDEAARWSGLIAREIGKVYRLFHCVYLMWLGALEEAQRALDELAIDAEKRPDGKLAVAIFRSFLSWRKGDTESAEQQLISLLETTLPEHPNQPDISNVFGMDRVMALSAAFQVEAGQPEEALARYVAAYPSPGNFHVGLRANTYFHPLLMTGVLLKLNGRAPEGRSLMHEYLASHEEFPIDTRDGTGFNRFLAYALLGRLEDARVELQNALELNFTANISMLELPRFDADYRRVMNDPDVAAMYQELLILIEAQLAAYREQPELAPERIPESLKSLSEVEAD